MDALDLEPHRPALFGRMRGMGFNRADADDLVQETFLHALGVADPVRSPAGLLAAIAVNLAIGQFRARKRRPPPIELELLYERPDESPDPCDLAIRADTARTVRQAVDDLPAHMGLVIEGLYYRRLSVIELAGDLGIEVGTIKSRHSRARERMRRRLQYVTG